MMLKGEYFMIIKNFETEITNTILKRGRDYFRHEHVVNIYERTDMNWQAEVEGTYNYTVAIELNEVEEIIDSSCNCPYDWERYCKHEAAVFFALREILNNQRKNVEKETITFQRHLQTKSKEELIQLILDLSLNNSRIHNELLHEMEQSENETNTAEELIIYHIDKAKNNGFINSGKVLEALEGVYLALDQVKGMVKSAKYGPATELSLVSLKHAVCVLSYADDSSGDIGGVIERSLSYLEEAAKKGVKNWSRKEKNTVFFKIINEATDKQLDSWTDWHFHLLTTGVYFCTEAKLRTQLNNVLESLLGQVTSESWEDKYSRGKLKAIQLEIISQSKDTKAIEEFLLGNLTDSNIRDQAILYSLDKKDFQQVLQLKIEREFS